MRTLKSIFLLLLLSLTIQAKDVYHGTYTKHVLFLSVYDISLFAPKVAAATDLNKVHSFRLEQTFLIDIDRDLFLDSLWDELLLGCDDTAKADIASKLPLGEVRFSGVKEGDQISYLIFQNQVIIKKNGTTFIELKSPHIKKKILTGLFGDESPQAFKNSFFKNAIKDKVAGETQSDSK